MKKEPDTAHDAYGNSGNRYGFATMRWSVILNRSGAGERALEHLCRTYWFPLYAYVRRSGHDRENAENLTRAFFDHLLSRPDPGGPEPAKGRFRTFLLTSIKRFLVDEWRKATAEKRGGEIELIPIDASGEEDRLSLSAPADPEIEFDRRWATAVIDRVYAKLGDEYSRAGKDTLFSCLRSCLSGPSEKTYDEFAAECGMSMGGFAMSVHRFRLRFGEEIRSGVADTTEDPANVEEEICWLLSILASDQNGSSVRRESSENP